MSRYAVALSLGPVGGFIGAGRRSRDLWWGSTWLSHATVEVAASLAERGAELVLPSKVRVAEIQRALRGGAGVGGRPELAYGGRVANHVLALVEGESAEEVARLLEGARARAHTWLAAQLGAALDGASAGLRRRAPGLPLERVVDTAAFGDQRAAIAAAQDFLEIHAAWSEVGPARDEGHALSEADRLLGARKSVRDFLAPRWTLPGRPKSDLDAGRDSVLLGDGPDLARAALGIRHAERLDAVGLARRIAAFEHPQALLGRLPFPPLSRIAVDPWLRGAMAGEGERAIRRIAEHLREALDDETTGAAFFAWCSPACDPALLPSTPLEEHRFPFDASVLFEGGVEAIAAELERVARRGSPQLAGAARGTRSSTLAEVQRLVRALHARFGPPVPYYALVSMDGDRVGSALREAVATGRLHRLVRGLDTFADQVEERVRARHSGRVLYAGGDDILFLVPLDHLLEALRDIAGAFREHLSDAPTPLHLSAGVVIAHVRADLRGVRALAAQALREAKRAREAGGAHLCLYDVPRSGVPRAVIGPFDELVRRLEEWSGGLRLGALSRRTPEILDGLSQTVGEAPDARQTASLDLARGRLLAQLARSRKPGRPLPPVVGTLMRRVLDEVQTWGDLGLLADEIRVASRVVSVDAAFESDGGSP